MDNRKAIILSGNVSCMPTTIKSIYTHLIEHTITSDILYTLKNSTITSVRGVIQQMSAIYGLTTVGEDWLKILIWIEEGIEPS